MKDIINWKLTVQPNLILFPYSNNANTIDRCIRYFTKVNIPFLSVCNDILVAVIKLIFLPIK